MDYYEKYKKYKQKYLRLKYLQKGGTVDKMIIFFEKCFKNPHYFDRMIGHDQYDTNISARNELFEVLELLGNDIKNQMVKLNDKLDTITILSLCSGSALIEYQLVLMLLYLMYYENMEKKNIQLILFDVVYKSSDIKHDELIRIFQLFRDRINKKEIEISVTSKKFNNLYELNDYLGKYNKFINLVITMNFQLVFSFQPKPINKTVEEYKQETLTEIERYIFTLKNLLTTISNNDLSGEKTLFRYLLSGETSEPSLRKYYHIKNICSVSSNFIKLLGKCHNTSFE